MARTRRGLYDRPVEPSGDRFASNTTNACSAIVPPGQVLMSLIGFSVLYLLLFVLWIFVLRREMLHGPEDGEPQEGAAA